jgi:ribose transport system permease protein
MMVARGFGSIVTSVTAKTYPSMHDEGGTWFSNVFLRVDTFPTGLLWLLAYFILASVVLNKTKLGRYIFAIGSNEEAVRLSGVNVANWKCAAYVISGFSMGLAAIFYAALTTTINPGTGNGFELEAIAGVIIGGTSLAGGVGSITGTMIGVFIMAILKTGLSSMNLPAPFQLFFTGLVVLGAVWLDMYRVRKANEVKKIK